MVLNTSSSPLQSTMDKVRFAFYEVVDLYFAGIGSDEIELGQSLYQVRPTHRSQLPVGLY